jgi:DNA repair exonuclease SbcCD nuclease subunit
VRGNSVVWSDIQEDYLLNVFPRQISEHGHNPSDSVLILEGDIFESRQAIDVRIFNRALVIFKQLSEMFRTVYIILGNHDVYYKKDNSVNSVQILSRLFPNVWVFEDPVKLNFNDKHTFLMIPWIESVEEITKVIERNANRAQYIVCHADIQGANLNKISKVEKGIDPHVLATYKRIHCGHIHLRQELKKYGASISYTGTPYSLDKADVGSQKGFDILTLVDDEIVEKFVPNTSSPMFIKKNLYSILEMNINEINDLFTNNFVEVMVDNKISARFSVQIFMDMIKDIAVKKIEFTPYTVKDNIDVKQIMQTAEGNGIDLSINNMFNLYMDQKGYDLAMRKRIEAKYVTFANKIKDQQIKD